MTQYTPADGKNKFTIKFPRLACPFNGRAGLQRWFYAQGPCKRCIVYGMGGFSSTGRLSGIRPATDGRRSPRLPTPHEPFYRNQVSGCGWRSRFWTLGGPSTSIATRGPRGWRRRVPAACEVQQNNCLASRLRWFLLWDSERLRVQHRFRPTRH